MQAKKKNKPHIIDRVANDIIKEIIPKYWTIRDYRPDYGIDLVLELFEKIEDDNYQTLGEHLFIQVKGIENVKRISYKVKKRGNVEKPNVNLGNDFKIIDVIPYQIETSELYTIQRMSNAIPVMLFAVDTKNKVIYYINVNDYIDKILIPNDPKYYDKKSKILYIPIDKSRFQNQVMQGLKQCKYF